MAWFLGGRTGENCRIIPFYKKLGYTDRVGDASIIATHVCAEAIN